MVILGRNHLLSGTSSTDVFIVGGGPAGLAAAIAASQRGLSVTVADGVQPPIDKACGEGLMPDTLLALAELGVSLPPNAGYPYRGLRFLDRNSVAQADFPEGQGIGLRRTVLHESLIARAESLGVRLMWKTPVQSISPFGVHLPNHFVRTRWIIGADGSRSRVRSWSGLPSAHRTRQRFASRRHYYLRPWSNHVEIYWMHRAQAYVTPVAQNELCVVFLADRPEHSAFDRALENLPALRERLQHAELASRERGAVTLMDSLPAVHSGNIALVGDASGGVDAITGDGLCLAFRQSLALAHALEHSDLQLYRRAHRALARKPSLVGELLLALGNRDSLRARLIPVLSRRPQLFSQLLRLHSTQSALSTWLSATAQLSWHLLSP